VYREKFARHLTPFSCYADPESGEWDPLDGELTEKLNTRSYVSLSRDRAGTAPAIPADSKSEDEVSLFDIGMPGVLTVDQVQALDLDHWLLFFRNNFVHMEVSLCFKCQFRR
jgi:arginine-tRNA-protein transferase